MLRDLKTHYLSTKCVAARLSVSAGSLTATYGIRDYKSPSSPSSGVFRLPLRDPFNRTPVCLATIGNSGSTGQIVSSIDATTNNKTVDFTTYSNGGTAGDSEIYSLIIGNHSPEGGYKSRGKRKVVGTYRNMRFFMFDVTGTGTAALGEGSKTATLTDNGTGDYTITLNRSVGSPCFALATVKDPAGTAASVRIASVTGKSVNVLTGNNLGTATDKDFMLLFCALYTSETKALNSRMPIKMPDLRPRMLFGRIDFTSGVPSLVINPTVGTLTDNGVGDVTLTFADAFKRTPIAIATPHDAAASVIVKSISTTSVRFQVNNTTPAVADIDFNFLVIGSDYDLEIGQR